MRRIHIYRVYKYTPREAGRHEMRENNIDPSVFDIFNLIF